jgi:murein DD-endopeptidase MepM/ murein hydrolase activator NlpD
LYTTVYAHMKYSPLVGSGAVVQKGQQIGVVGNTGYSFGPHLHFELHRGEWKYSKSNAVNPQNYLP